MKTMKKVLALLVAVLMIAASVSAFAAEDQPTTHNVKFSGGKAGHTYTIYQVLVGKNSTTARELTNIQWGADVTDTFKAGYDTAAAYAKGISTMDGRAVAQALVTANALTGGAEVKLTADGEVNFGAKAEGYYVIIDTNTNSGAVDGDYDSAYIVEVVEDVDGAIKGSAPSSEKKVKDTNDSDKDHSGDTFADSADYDIGDLVPFQITATTAGNVNAFKTYHITFVDDQSEGLDAPEKFTVTFGEKSVDINNAADASGSIENDDANIAVAVIAAGADFSIKVTFTPKEGQTYLPEALNSKNIVVSYSSELNSSAKIGSEGNPNTSNIKYSRNPESTDDSEEGETPDDTVKVFTYKTVVDKVDAEGNSLKGAGFTLYKVVEDYALPTTGTAEEKNASVAGASTSIKGTHVLNADTAGTTFSFDGLDDGTYVLCETTTPRGYNTMDPVKFTVTATHDANKDDPQLLTLEASTPFAASADGSGKVTKTNNTEHQLASGEIYDEVINNSGSTLPETGGIGTTIFYIAGSLLAIGAAILLITKRRMGSDE